MTLWEYAVARTYRQLQKISAERPLTAREGSLQQVLEPTVRRYEADEAEAFRKQEAV